MFLAPPQFQILFFLLVGLSLTSCDVQPSQRLPSIWINEAGEMNYYRFRAELQLLNAGKSFVIEEWVSTWRQMFRFDLIRSPGDVRISFLANKRTSEMFRYEPFSCSLMRGDISQDRGAAISADLAGVFPLDSSDTLLPVGIGALWLHALKLESTFTPAADEESSRRTRSSARVFARYDRYTIPSTKINPLGSTFYFHQASSPTVVASLKSLAMIELQDSSRRVVMRIKVLEAEENWQGNGDNVMSDNNPYLDVFDLPAGYGCQRTAQFDQPFSIEPVPGDSYLVHMDMVSTQPRDLEQDFAQWKSHSASARLLTGHLDLGNGDTQLKNRYLIMEAQDHAADEISPKMYNSEMRRATVRRLKRVWDFGAVTNDPNQSDRNTVRYFELDLLSGRCLKHCDLSTNTFVDLTRDATSNKQDKPAPLDELSFDFELLQQFLFDLSGFHLLKDAFTPKSRELAYERRFDSLAIRNALGELIWEGPVSVVRYYTKDPLKQSVEIAAVVYFLSRNRDRLVGKFHVTTSERRSVSAAHLHQSINVGSCFSTLFNERDNGDTNRLHVRQRSQNGGTRFAITYSIEPEALVEEVTDSEEFEVSIYEHLLRELFYLSNKQLEPLQLVDMDIDFDSSQSVAKVSARLLDKPSLLSYIEQVDLRFANSSPPSATLLTELKANGEGCAESCQHYGCPMFAYCKKTKICNLLMAGYKPQVNGTSPLLEPDSDCSLFKARSGRDEPSRKVNLAHLLHQMQRAILDSKQEPGDSSNIDLKLQLDFIDTEGSKKEVTLSPIKLESGALQLDDSDESDAMQPDRVGELDVAGGLDEEQLPRAEYILMFKNRKYKRPLEADTNLFPLQEASHMSYEQCEALCEQSDCRSFSHCQLEQVCQVSLLHESSSIKEHIEQDDLCFVMTRDYLSKFEQVIQVPKPQNSLIRPEKVATNRDCAIRCMEEQKFKCLSFLYCSFTGAAMGQVDTFDGSDCYLRHTHTPTIQADPSPKKSVAGDSPNVNLQPMCDLYTRSFLAEFDKYYGKALPKNVDAGEQVGRLVIKGFGSEFCALKCFEHDNCAAFQACHDTDSDGPFCTLLTWTDTQGNLLNGLVDDTKCTTFILSTDDKSNDSGEDLDQTTGELGSHLGQQPSGGHWFAILLLLVIGLAFGYGLAMKFVPRYP